MDDLSDTVDEMAEAFTIHRRGIATLVNGRAVESAMTEIEATGVVTPATSRDLLRLPEGRRTEQVKRIITSTALLMLPTADVIEFEGILWEVQKADRWGSFYDCLATKRITQS